MLPNKDIAIGVVEDLIFATVLRHSPDSVVTVAIYMLICRELNQAAIFPGNEYFWNTIDDNSYAPSLQICFQTKTSPLVWLKISFLQRSSDTAQTVRSASVHLQQMECLRW
jgi:hypothetical protein